MFKLLLLVLVRHLKAFTIKVKVVHACVHGESVQAGLAYCVYALLCRYAIVATRE